MNNSFWWKSLPDWQSSDPITHPDDFDVLIVGAGYTGLWTAFFLKQENPSLSIGIVESEHVGFGASGRNGGWVSSLWPVSLKKIAKSNGVEAATNFQLLLHKLVKEFGQTLSENQIDADFQYSGTVNLARSVPQLSRLRNEIDEYSEFGFSNSDYRLEENPVLLPAATHTLSGLVSPHCASIQPAKLVRALAEVVLSQGIKIFENSTVREIGKSEVVVNDIKVSARNIVIATEGYAHQLKPRTTAPIHSLMFVTDPIPSKLLDELRIAPGLTFNDSRNLIIYGQRTYDNRIAFGGRGAPYRFGSKTGSQVELYQPAFDYLKQTLIEMFPDLREYTLDASHFWGGPIGVARNWQPSISYDKQTGIARAGNYVGDGVLASYLAGKTLADLLNFKSTQLINQPWVNQRSRKWEIEPLRYLFINSARIAIDIADRIESASGKESIVTRLLWRILKG